MSSSGRSLVIGRRMHLLGVLAACVWAGMESTPGALAGRAWTPPGRGGAQQNRQPVLPGGRLGGNGGRQSNSAGAGRQLPASGSGRRMSSPGMGRNLSSPGFGRTMADSGSGRALAPIGGQVPSGGAAGSSVPIGLRYGSGVSSHGIPRGISVWPDAQAPYGGGPDPIGPAGPGDPLDRSGWVEGLEASADTAQLGSEEFEPALGVIEAPHPMEDLADQLASTGRLQLSQGEIYLAEASLSNAVALFTSDPIMRIEYALALAAVGNFAGARTELIDGFRMQPELVVESLNVVSAYGGEELFLERMEQIDRYRESFPLDSDSLFVRAFLAFHAGALEAAREDFLLLRSNDPKFPFLSAFTKQLELLDLTKPSEPRQPAEPAQGDPDGEAGDDPDGEAGEDPAKASGGPDR